MKFKNTAIMMIFWLFCQQAGAAAVTVVEALPHQNESELAMQTDVPCHEKNMPEGILDATPEITKFTNTHSHRDTIQKIESNSDIDGSCCDVSCQCCVSGCQSMLSGGSDQSHHTSSMNPEDNYSFVVPQVLSSSLFRPPIIS